jgi:hypothetical protein
MRLSRKALPAVLIRFEICIRNRLKPILKVARTRARPGHLGRMRRSTMAKPIAVASAAAPA